MIQQINNKTDKTTRQELSFEVTVAIVAKLLPLLCRKSGQYRTKTKN